MNEIGIKFKYNKNCFKQPSKCSKIKESAPYYMTKNLAFKAQNPSKIPIRLIKKTINACNEKATITFDIGEQTNLYTTLIDKLSSINVKWVNKYSKNFPEKTYIARDLKHMIDNALQMMIFTLGSKESTKINDTKTILSDIIKTYKCNYLFSEKKNAVPLDIFNFSLQSLKKIINSKNIKINVENKELIETSEMSSKLKECELFNVFLNVTQNAVKYSHNGGNVKIDFQQVKIPDKGSFLKFSVQDNGIGIENKEIEKLFNREIKRGTNTKDIYGTGLGLKRLKNILGRDNIEISSKINEGTTVTCYIPLNEV